MLDEISPTEGGDDAEPDAPDAAANDAETYDPDALVARLRRNAIASLAGLSIVVGLVWQEVMAVVGMLLGGGVVLVNFVFLERLVSRLLEGRNRAPSPLQLAFLAFRVVLLGLFLYGIFALPGVRPIPVALGLSVLVLAVVIESLSAFFSAQPPRV